MLITGIIRPGENAADVVARCAARAIRRQFRPLAAPMTRVERDLREAAKPQPWAGMAPALKAATR